MGKYTKINRKQVVKSPTRGNDTTTLGANSVGTTQLQALSINGSKLQPQIIEEQHLTTDALNALSKYVKNYVMNADMAIAQRGTSFASIANAAYSLDRWKYEKTGAMVHTITQDTDVPTVAQAGVLFQNSIRLNLTTPDTSIAATDYCFFGQHIEGYHFASLAQKIFTISFWVKATTTGIYSVGLRNSGNDRSFVGEFTVDVSNTWEKKTIVVPASPSAGTWNYTNGSGIYLQIVLACGTTYQSTPGAWQTGSNLLASTNQVNGVNTGATDFRMTGIMVNEGSVAAPFRTFSNNSYEQELLNCYRYYWRWDATGDSNNNRITAGQCVATTSGTLPFRWPVRMRAIPTPSITTVGAFALTLANDGLNGLTNLTFGETTRDGTYFSATVSGGLVAGNATQLTRNGSSAGILEANAEL